ncbi:CLUMA_CG001791, isoform A [Clunio marinus]|uniref:Pyrroline-5-carboxylate reductase n=1 Tax=Clunio marinus TaxID=568069 RepID=A0A1J1HJ17_9DIPT|nr:CLUMA_CG001791, isoform A [Clunio marinus]
MNKILKIGFIGGGKMAQAMAKGMISAGLTESKHLIASVHPSDKASLEAFRDFGAEAVTNNRSVVEKSDVVFLSVKPNVVKTALTDVKSISSGKLFVSIAMGITLQEIEKNLNSDSRVIRAMPNTPAIVQAAASVFVRGSKATSHDAKLIQTLFESIGTCDEVSEYMMDPVTALSGSGPAYIFVLIEALADGGVKMGLPRDLAYRLASQTVMGSGKLVIQSGIHPAVLKDNVTSPAGSTASGLHNLEKNNFRNAIIGAIEAATERCHEISNTQP